MESSPQSLSWAWQEIKKSPNPGARKAPVLSGYPLRCQTPPAPQSPQQGRFPAARGGKPGESSACCRSALLGPPARAGTQGCPQRPQTAAGGAGTAQSQPQPRESPSGGKELMGDSKSRWELSRVQIPLPRTQIPLPGMQKEFYLHQKIKIKLK